MTQPDKDWAAEAKRFVETWYAADPDQQDEDLLLESLENWFEEIARSAYAEGERAERRNTVDRDYMIQALVSLLGPKGRQVWDMWQSRNVKRVHHCWGPDAAAMTGEERAQVLLDWEAAPREVVQFVDSQRKKAIRAAKETKE